MNLKKAWLAIPAAAALALTACAGGGGSAATGAGGQRERSRRGNGEPCLLQVHGYYLLVDGRDRWAMPVVMSSRVARHAWKYPDVSIMCALHFGYKRKK